MSKITLLASLIALILLGGCSNRVILHPILKEDIVILKTGESYTADRDGFFLSKRYVREVMDVKVEKLKLK